TVDVVFLALHGEFGEDGQVQQLLEEVGVPYTGSDVRASRRAFSKSASKERFLQHDVPTPRHVVVHETEDASTIRRYAQSVGYPLVVKPDRQGSSLGVRWVRGPAELAEAVARSFRFDAFSVLEAAVVGSEWTVGLLDELTLPPIRIETPRGVFDYQAKYEDGSTRYRFAWPDQSPTAAAVVRVARAACDALGVQGLARVDLRVDRDGQPWVLEVNTIPGMTSHSLVPKAAEQAGLGLAGLCELALERSLRRAAVHRRSA
ncbi:MAG TPA: D-alanine--D-alanine ligase, partial [Planctomycetaceae bacterium]|nr:D-alanine--D-alanine ligase [Planctomycetaceae bacterium]